MAQSLDPLSNDPAMQRDTRLWHGLLVLARGVDAFQDTGLSAFLVSFRRRGGRLGLGEGVLRMTAPPGVSRARLVSELGANRALLNDLLVRAADGFVITGGEEVSSER